MNKIISGFKVFFESLTRKRIFKESVPALILVVVFSVLAFLPMYLGKRADIEKSNNLIIETATKSLEDTFKNIDEVYRNLEGSIEGLSLFGSAGIVKNKGEALDKITENIGQGAITDYNIPMKVGTPVTTARVATALMRTSATTVIAPVGINDEWTPAEDAPKQQFDTVIQSVETGRDTDGNTVTSYVMAFASVEYIQSTWASYAELCNQNIVMAVSDRAAHVTDTSITFTSKFIKNESFIADEATSNTLNWIFVIILPILVIALGVVIFVRRRNAR